MFRGLILSRKPEKRLIRGDVTEQTAVGVGEQYTITKRILPFSPAPPPPTRFSLPAPRERCLSMPEIGEKERNYLFKSYTGLE